MKSRIQKLFCVVLVTATALLLGMCTTNSQTESTTPVAISALPRSMKGYELYSWQAEGKWNFTLITGTNRLKSANEITTGPDTVRDDGWVKLGARSIDALKLLLAQIPKDGSISWRGKQTLARFGVEPGPLEMPPQAIVDAITGYCKDLGLGLYVSP